MGAHSGSDFQVFRLKVLHPKKGSSYVVHGNNSRSGDIVLFSV